MKSIRFSQKFDEAFNNNDAADLTVTCSSSGGAEQFTI
jgi:hypothetical protein